jgi:hypothetical protein
VDLTALGGEPDPVPAVFVGHDLRGLENDVIGPGKDEVGGDQKAVFIADDQRTRVGSAA